MTSYLTRPLTAEDLAGLHVLHQHAFHEGPRSQRSYERMARRIELDRSTGVFDGESMVGAAGVFSFRMRIPGALAAVAGVSMIAVLPSHRRRGILSAMIGQQFTGIAERREAVAALFASEAGIYGRFGYGRASWHLGYSLRGGEGRLAASAPVDKGLRVRICDPYAARPELAKVYELMLGERPGFFARNDAWWDRVLGDPEEPSDDGGLLRCVIAEDDAGPRGYALYSGKDSWDQDGFLPECAVEIGEVMTADPAAAAAIWGDLLSRDLTSEFHAALRPVDDPLLFLLADPRRARPRLTDGLWIRLVDVGGALAQRRYACPADVVIEVTDPVCPANQGRWRLAAGQDGPAEPGEGFGGTCEKTAAPADITLPVEVLGSAYLGGTRLGPMAMAGLVTEHSRGAVAALSAAMTWDPAPWCPVIF